MLQRVFERPDTLDHLDKDDLFFVVLSKNLHCADVGVEIAGDVAHIHIIVPKWNREAGCAVVQDFALLKDFLKDRGCAHAVASNDNLEDEKRWTKFIELFGFPKPQKVLISTRAI